MRVTFLMVFQHALTNTNKSWPHCTFIMLVIFLVFEGKWLRGRWCFAEVV